MESVITPLDERRRRRALRTLVGVVGAFLVAVGLIALFLWLSWQRVYWADQVTTERAQLEQLQLEQQTLEARVAFAFSLNRIQRYATETLGMVEPELYYWPLLP